jgi:hypothetical protein
MLALLKEIVTLTLSSFKTNWSGGGKKSFTILSLPIVSSVYFILFFINLSPLSPVSCSENPDYIFPIRESHGYYAVIDATDAIRSFLLPAAMG